MNSISQIFLLAIGFAAFGCGDSSDYSSSLSQGAVVDGTLAQEINGHTSTDCTSAFCTDEGFSLGDALTPENLTPLQQKLLKKRKKREEQIKEVEETGLKQDYANVDGQLYAVIIATDHALVSFHIGELVQELRNALNPDTFAKNLALRGKDDKEYKSSIDEDIERIITNLYAYTSDAPTKELSRYAATSLVRVLKQLEDVRYRTYAWKFYEQGMFTQCNSYPDCDLLIFDFASMVEAVPDLIGSEELKNGFYASIENIENHGVQELLRYRFQTVALKAFFYEKTGIAAPDAVGKNPYMHPDDIKVLREKLFELTREETLQQARQRAGVEGGDPRNFWSRMVDFRLVDGKIYPNKPTMLKIQNEDVLYRLIRVLLFEKMGEDYGFKDVATILEEGSAKSKRLFKLHINSGANSLKEMSLSDKSALGEYAINILHSLYRTHYGNLALLLYTDRLMNPNPKLFLHRLNTAISDGVYGEQRTDYEPMAMWFALQSFQRYELRLPYRSEWLATFKKLTLAMIKEKDEFRRQYRHRIKTGYPDFRVAGDEISAVLPGEDELAIFARQVIRGELYKDFEPPQQGDPAPSKIPLLDELAHMDLQGNLTEAIMIKAETDESLYAFFKERGLTAFLDENQPPASSHAAFKGSFSMDDKEQYLAGIFRGRLTGFHSFYHEYMQALTGIWNLLPLYTKFSETDGAHKKEAIGQEMAPLFAGAEEPHLRLACYGYFLYHGVPESHWGKSMEEKVAVMSENQRYVRPFLGDEKVDLRNVCGYQRGRLRNALSNYMTKKEHQAIYKERNTKIYMQLAELPVILWSSSIAGAASHPARMFLTGTLREKFRSQAYQSGLRLFFKRLAAWSTTRFGSHALSATMGAALFTVSQTGFSVAGSRLVNKGMNYAGYGEYAPDPMPLYDPDQGFWHNYGESLTTGAVIFMLLPPVQNMFRRMGRSWAGLSDEVVAEEYMTRRAFSFFDGKRAKIAAGELLGDALIFGSAVPFYDRLVKKLYQDNPDDLYPGSTPGEMFSNALPEWASGALISMWFYASHRVISPFANRIQYRGTKLKDIPIGSLKFAAGINPMRAPPSPEYLKRHPMYEQFVDAKTGKVVDLWGILNVPPGTSHEPTLRKAKARIQRDLHEDRTGNPVQRYNEAQNAYDLLKNPSVREVYIQFTKAFESEGLWNKFQDSFRSKNPVRAHLTHDPSVGRGD